MQKKIKIPKLSLNHVEETGEVTDYGEEDVELRHSKVLKTFLFFLYFWGVGGEVLGAYTDFIV